VVIESFNYTISTTWFIQRQNRIVRVANVIESRETLDVQFRQ